eukprot:1158251-Pelagomonas_calceolata.AAC.4
MCHTAYVSTGRIRAHRTHCICAHTANVPHCVCVHSTHSCSQDTLHMRPHGTCATQHMCPQDAHMLTGRLAKALRG